MRTPNAARTNGVALWLFTLAAAAVFSCHDHATTNRGNAAPDSTAPVSNGRIHLHEDEHALGEEHYPPTARPDMVRDLRADDRAERHPSDGGGRAWLETGGDSPPRASVSQPGRWTVIYEAGPLGVAEGGTILLKISPFWGWSSPQASAPEWEGYTRVASLAKGVELEATERAPLILGIEVKGRKLETGERIRIEYGAGERGAKADKFAERGSRFWIAVDGDGDGTSALLVDSPAVDVDPAPPSRMVLTLPSSARPGEDVRAVLAVLDAYANTGLKIEGTAVFEDVPSGLQMPDDVRFAADDLGRKSIAVRVVEPGTYRIKARLELDHGEVELSCESNPLRTIDQGPRIFWGDLHGHSNFSDGTGLPEDYFTYARDVARLDIAALTDHDHWGMLFLDRHPDMWQEIERETERFHEPGRFVTLLGYEWTSWIWGHRHVLYMSNHGALHSSWDESTDTPEELWAALRGKDALTFAHHSAGGPIATDWSIPPDPVLEPVTEVVSAHGSSEAMDSPRMIYSPVPGNFVRDALDRGYRLGFVGSGDGHDGHPGFTWLSPEYPTGGLAAILAEELSRESVLAALRARKVYATSGARIVLRCALSGRPMGSAIKASELGPEAILFASVVGTSEIESLDIVRSGRVVDSIPGENSAELGLSASLRELVPGEYVYLRVVQKSPPHGDGGLAWSSPFFIE